MTYEQALRKLERVEAEVGCELSPLSDPTLANRARRVLHCDDPPAGEDRDFCYDLLTYES